MSDDLKTLFPSEVVTVTGEPLTVHPFYFGQLSRVVKFCKPIAEALLSSGIMTITTNADNTANITLNSDFVPKLFQIMDDGAEPLLCLVALAVGKPREWLDKIPLDEGILLTQKLWDMNSDFFVKRVMPMLAKNLIKLQSTGETSSPVSSAPVIAATI